MDRFLVLILALSAVCPAEARLLSSADGVSEQHQAKKATETPSSESGSTWSQLQVVAKQKVNEWTNYFNQKVNELKEGSIFSGSDKTAEPGRKVASVENETSSGSAAVNENTSIPAVSGPSGPIEANEQSGSRADGKSTSANEKTEEQKQFADIIQQTRSEIAAKTPLQVVNPGRAGTTVLPKTKVGVTVYVPKVKSISRIDIGLEVSISKTDLVPAKLSVAFQAKKKVKELESPLLFPEKEIAKLRALKLPLVAKASPPKHGDFELGQMVTQKKIDAVSLEMQPNKPLEAMKPYVEISRDELNLIAAVILFDKKNQCHIASGLFADLAEKKPFAEEANFYLGVCAHQMGFHSEAVNRLLKVIESEHPDYTQEAITSLVEDLPREYDSRVAVALKSLKNKNFIDEKVKDNAHFILARAAHAKNSYEEATDNAEKVSEKSPRYADARYLFAIGLYGQKKLKEAEQTLLNLREWTEKKGKKDKNLDALIAVNLGRMRFAQGRHQSAHEEYLRIPKDHPLWVQALIEQGWVQLSIDDPEGAIGNMYSLHSPYFKSVFMPESWVVRTIGYIDICQYGDAYKSLTRLEQLHSHWLSSIDRYIAEMKTPANYYDTVKNYIRGRSDQNTDGLPYQVIREIARQRGFLNAQNALNVIEDEIAQYNFIYGLVKKDQTAVAHKLERTKLRLAKVKADLEKAKTTPDLIKHINEWNAQRRIEEQLVRAYQFQKDLYEEARQGYLKMKASSLARIDRDKAKLRTAAGRALMTHLKDIHSRISQILEGNEFLRYEIFSGSGENIRYQVSGGATSDVKRVPANVKPQKLLNWEFDGEYWEDEIGSYRSTLKNNCPKNPRVARPGESGVSPTVKN